MQSSIVTRDNDNDDWAVRHANFCVALFKGTKPTSNEDVALNADKLVVYTLNNAGAAGGTWAASAGGTIHRTSAEVLQGTGLVTGIATWGRLYIFGDDPLIASTTLDRIQGDVGKDFFLTDVNITIGVDSTLGDVLRVRPEGT